MAAYEIPLEGHPETFSIALNGTTYILTVQYRNALYGGWFLDIADASATSILSGIPLVTGADLLGPHKNLGIAGGAALYITNTAGGDSDPTFDNLGADTHLVMVI